MKEAIAVAKDRLVKALTYLQENYNGYDGDIVCAFGWFSKDGSKVEWYEDAPCHAGVGYRNTLKGTSALFASSLWHCTNRLKLADAERFWRILFDPKVSPYRSVLDDSFQFIKHKGRLIGWVLANKDADLETSVSLCIASRMPYEHTDHVRAVLALVDRGFPPEVALYIGMQCTLRGRVMTRVKNHQGHHPLQNHMPIMFRAFSEGKTLHKKSGKTLFNALNGYGETGTIFSPRDSVPLTALDLFLAKIEHKEPPLTYTGIFPNKWNSHLRDSNSERYKLSNMKPEVFKEAIQDVQTC